MKLEGRGYCLFTLNYLTVFICTCAVEHEIATTTTKKQQPNNVNNNNNDNSNWTWLSPFSFVSSKY